MIKFDLISKYGKIFPEKIALVDDEISISWGDLKQQVGKLAAKINNDRKLYGENPCLFLSHNSAKIVLIGAAMATCGIPFSGIDYHLDIDTIKSIIHIMNVRSVFVSRELYDKFKILSGSCSVLIVDEYISDLKEGDVCCKALTDEFNKKYKSYAFTSGTTGIPKIVFRTKSFDVKRFDYLNQRYGFNSNDIHLACLPMYHVSSTGWIRQFLSLGCTVVIHNYKNGYKLCDLMHKKSITTAIMSPIMLKSIVDEMYETSLVDYFSSLRFIITGGKNCTSHLKTQAIKKLGNIIYEYYGTTETGVNTLLDPSEATLYKGSVGREFVGNEIVILDAANKPVLSYEVGRIAIHSYMNMDDYLNAKAEFVTVNSKKYLLTADYGYKNLEGYLYVIQRTQGYVPHVYNFHAIEDDILNLFYVSDVFVSKLAMSGKVNIDIVTKKYRPYKEIKDEINKIASKYGVKDVTVNIQECLNYTMTGKMRLPQVRIDTDILN